MSWQKSSKAHPAQAVGGSFDRALPGERAPCLCGGEAVAAGLVLRTEGKDRWAVAQAD